MIRSCQEVFSQHATVSRRFLFPEVLRFNVPQRQAGAMKVRLRGPMGPNSKFWIIAIHLAENRGVACNTTI